MTTLKDQEKRKALCARLARVEGQLRGIQKLIETDADCEKIAQQLSAARKALDRSFFSMVGCMMQDKQQSMEKVTEMLVKYS
jgi:CsoR family transcriptional regulator, copper-sensing transcriptional repressor